MAVSPSAGSLNEDHCCDLVRYTWAAVERLLLVNEQVLLMNEQPSYVT